MDLAEVYTRAIMTAGLLQANSDHKVRRNSRISAHYEQKAGASVRGRPS
jgi:hypothetical protein